MKGAVLRQGGTAPACWTEDEFKEGEYEGKTKLSGWQRKRKNNDMKNMMEIKAIMKQGHNDERSKKI